MTEFNNRAGQLAIVVPFEDAAADIKAHGGKIVTPIRHRACVLGPSAWTTDPVHFDGYGNALAWDDRDLKPLGEKPPQHSKTTTQTILTYKSTTASLMPIKGMRN